MRAQEAAFRFSLALNSWLGERLRTALGSLPARYRVIVVLRHRGARARMPQLRRRHRRTAPHGTPVPRNRRPSRAGCRESPGPGGHPSLTRHERAGRWTNAAKIRPFTLAGLLQE